MTIIKRIEREKRTERKKTWKQKIAIVTDSYNRSKNYPLFASQFYDNLFFLNPKIERYFKTTKFEHQFKALMYGLQYLVDYLDESKRPKVKNQILRIARSHSHENLGIHPRDYYYWIEALIMTLAEADPKWEKHLEYYWREVLFFPISFIISQYYISDND